MAALVFKNPRNTAPVRKGRPALFTAEVQDALRARPNEFAVIQTGIKSASRVSVLRAKYGQEGFEFKHDAETDGTITVFARAVVAVEAPAEAEAEVETPAPATAKAPRPSRSRAAREARAAAAAAAAE